MQLRYKFGALAILASVIAPNPVFSHPQEETGTVILHAIDAESGEPMADVSFAIENSLGEMWAVTVGTSDVDGKLQLESKQRSGYFFSVFPVPEGYKITGLDAVPSSIKLGETTEHRFHLRQLDAKVSVPDLVPRPKVAEKHLPDPGENGSRTTEKMPGFEGQSVQFYADEKTAEDIFRNGKRLRAAIEDELLYFKKSEGAKAGNIKKIRDVKIVDGSGDGWIVWCRTEGSLKLNQDGFKIHFNSKFDKWNLYVPDYLHPDFGSSN